MANAAYDLLEAMVQRQIDLGKVDTQVYFDGESINARPLVLREKLVRSILHTYSAEVPQ